MNADRPEKHHDEYIYEAARLLSKLLPLLGALVEARKDAAQGKWWMDNGITVQGENGNYGITLDKDFGGANKNQSFAVLSANTMTEISKLLEGV